MGVQESNGALAPLKPANAGGAPAGAAARGCQLTTFNDRLHEARPGPPGVQEGSCAMLCEFKSTVLQQLLHVRQSAPPRCQATTSARHEACPLVFNHTYDPYERADVW